MLNRVGPRIAFRLSPQQSQTDALIAFLHRPADLRGRAVDRHHDRGGDRAADTADLGVSGDCSSDRQHSGNLSGASAEVLAQTVATPIEQEVNGVDDMLYINSQAVGDGTLNINVVFKPGTDVDTAQVLVQNRVSVAEPRLPEDVRRLGVTVRKASPDLMMVVHMISPDSSRDQQYISNYATLYIKDMLARVDGVGDVRIFGARDYSMRIWLDPGELASRDLTAGDVVAALGQPICKSRRERSTSPRPPRRVRFSCRCRRSGG